MARRMKSKIQPAEQTLIIPTPVVNSNRTDSFYVDLSQCASLVNRRFYRQGLNWVVSSIKILTTDFIGSVHVNKLPNTWVFSNSWEKGFRHWQRMNKQATDDTSVSPKFLDFKIYADATHHQKGSAANLLPVDSTGNVAKRGEWEYSKFVIPQAGGTTGNIINFEIIGVGKNFPGPAPNTLDAVSLIEGYANSRSLPNVIDPNIPKDATDASGLTPENWLGALFNEGTQQDDAVLQDMLENNQAPYPFEKGIDPDTGNEYTDTHYPGGENQLPELVVHDLNFITPTTIGGETICKGGNFPCGLIKFTCINDSNTNANLVFQINLVPGPHRGYLAESMTEM